MSESGWNNKALCRSSEMNISHTVPAATFDVFNISPLKDLCIKEHTVTKMWIQNTKKKL